MRRRGPKPVRLRAHFAATAWLDGEIHWENGRIVWQYAGRSIPVGHSEISSVSKALVALRKGETAARRERRDFDAWYAARIAKWRLARRLATVDAPDLEALVSQSRRRNPAAIERLSQLLLVEGLVAKPLPYSPAQALYEAWPLSRLPLRSVLRDLEMPAETQALAAMIIGACAPFRAFPTDPFLRRTAHYGARYGFPKHPQLVVLLLREDTPSIEACVARLEAIIESDFYCNFTAEKLQSLLNSGHNASSLFKIVESGAAYSDPFPPLTFTFSAASGADLAVQRELTQFWKDSRSQFRDSIHDYLLAIARQGTYRDLEATLEILRHLISNPLKALGAVESDGKKRKRRVKKVSTFEQSVEEAITFVLELLKQVADCRQSGALLQLLREVLQHKTSLPEGENLLPAVWSSRWLQWLRSEHREIFSILTVAN
ncbi:hypothetical protein EON80_28030, partial [bacterium]